MYFFFIVDNLTFLLFNALPAAGIYVLTGQLYGDKRERTAAGMLLYFTLELALFLLLGYCKLLHQSTFVAGNILCGAAAFGIGSKLKRRQIAKTASAAPAVSRTSRLLNFLILALFISYFYYSMLLAGTDTWLYHLFFPHEWIKAGKIYPISLAGLPHEYFPIAGEALFGCWLLAGNVNIFYPALQIFTLLMAVMAMAALWKSFNYPAIFISGAIILVITPGIISSNATICNTDVITGAFLVTGISFMLLALQEQRGKLDIFTMILSGVALGISAGTKYSGLVAAPLLTLLLLCSFYLLKPLRENAGNLRQKTMVLLLAAGFTAAIFYLPNLLRTGNPFYPVKLPPLFPQGVDFPRETNTLFSAWNFFVSDNLWNLNHATGFLYALLPLAAIGISTFALCRKKADRKTWTLLVLASAIEIVFFIHLLIYPAMAQARQIIPLLMTAALLLPELLTFLMPDAEKTALRSALFLMLIYFAANALMLNLRNYKLNLIFTAFWVPSLIYALLTSPKWRKAMTVLTLIAGATISFCYFIHCRTCYAWHMTENAGPAGRVIGDTIIHSTLSEEKIHIASVGSWFNGLLTLPIDNNTKVSCIPVNAENTTSPHKLQDISYLRHHHVDFPVYLERLRSNGVTHMLVDLSSHADYLANRRLELDWAMAHPEHFELIFSDGKIFFFAVK
ncbi:MAG: hypothetical protein IKD22_01205 [Lentisphaeria bacterium]|nr:hypothetical protein [Lentisphaeria bacterium]